MKKILPINTTSDGCAFTVRARYDGACLKSLTGGADITRTRELLKSMDARILKIRFPKDKRSDGLSIYPWNFLPFAPPLPVRFRFVQGDGWIRHLPFCGHNEDKRKFGGISESL